MAFDDDLESEADRILQSLRISIVAQAGRTAITLGEFIETQRVSGLGDREIQTLLLRDLNEGGRIFGEFRRSFELNVEGGMGELANASADVRFGRDATTEKVWIAALVNTCPDCLPRHGEIDTEENWSIRGKPRTGWSVCRKNCQCQLLLAEDAVGRPELEKPLQRSK